MSQEILAKFGTLEKQNAELLTNVGNLQSETKKALEEFTTLKNQHGDLADQVRAMAKLNANLAQERRLAFGNPAQRLLSDRDGCERLAVMLLKMAGAEKKVGTRLRRIVEAHSKEVGEYLQTRDLDTGSTPGSTYLNLGELEANIYDVLSTYGAYSSLNFRTFASKSVKIPVKTARPVFQWLAEGAQVSADSTKAGSAVTLTPGKAAALLKITNEMLEDDAVGIVRDVMDDFGQGGAYALDWIAFSADGGADATDGGFTGMFSGGTAVTAASGNTTVATLDFEDFVKVAASAPAAVLSRPNRWWMHPSLLVKTLYIKDGNGRPIFNTALEAPSYGAIGSILGRPVTAVDAAPSTDSAGALIACFGDPEAMAVRVRRVLEMKSSEHFSFDTDEVAYLATLRGCAAIKAASAIRVLKTAAS